MTEQSQQWGLTARRWWKRFYSPERGNPGARARLRRARDRVEAALVVEALQLARTLAPTGESSNERFGAALDLARVLSHITTDDDLHPMRVLGWERMPTGQSDEPRPKLSVTRFRRFLLATDGDERVDAFVRLIDLLRGTANVAEITDAFQWWDHPEGRVRQSWAFTYYNAAGFVPDAMAKTTSEEPA